jgi:glucose/mannose-6-phosphate isomerase
MMRQSIENFAKQFAFDPAIERAEARVAASGLAPKHFIVGGMGGSHLAAGLVKAFRPGAEVYVRRDYGLPPFDDSFMKESLFVACSHSGNTEETLDFAQAARAKGYAVAAITTGGTLADGARSEGLPLIVLPADGIQPRIAIGYATIALSRMIGDEALVAELRDAMASFDPTALRERGETLAKHLYGNVPLVCASVDNLALAYNWKIKFNETAKSPAFYNVFPELNHNEMTGFDVMDGTRSLSAGFRIVMLKDLQDDPRIQNRMDITAALYRERGLSVEEISIDGATRIERVFSSLVLADWTALALAERYGVEAEQVPMVEDFKKRLA